MKIDEAVLIINNLSCCEGAPKYLKEASKAISAFVNKESRPRLKRAVQQRKDKICREKHCQLARDGGICSNTTCSTGCGYYRVKLQTDVGAGGKIRKGQ